MNAQSDNYNKRAHIGRVSGECVKIKLAEQLHHKHTHAVNGMNIYLHGGRQSALRSAALPADSKMYLSGVYYQFDFIFSLPEV